MKDGELYLLKRYYERLESGSGNINVLKPEERIELAGLLEKRLRFTGNQTLSHYAYKSGVFLSSRSRSLKRT